MIVRARAPIYGSGLPPPPPPPPPTPAPYTLARSEPAPDHPGAVIVIRTNDDIWPIRQRGFSQLLVEPRRFEPDPGGVYAWSQTRDASDPHFLSLFGTIRVVQEPQRFAPDAGSVSVFTTRITPTRMRPILASAEPPLPFPGAVIQIRAPYGISPLPARPIMARITVPGGENPPPHAGSVYTVQPRATSTRPRTANPQMVAVEPLPLHGGSVLATHPPLEVSHPGRTVRVTTEEPVPASGSALSTHPPAVHHRTVPPQRGPLTAAVERLDDRQAIQSVGRVDASPARSIVAQRPIRIAEVATADLQPITSHGTPARVVPIGVSRTVRDDSVSEDGRVFASHGPGGPALPPQPLSLARASEENLGDGAAAHSHGAAGSPVATARPRIVAMDAWPADAAAVWHTSPMPPPPVPFRTSWMVRGDSLEPEHFAVKLVLKTSPVAPSPPPPTPLIGIRVYLTGVDRSVVTISSLDCCEEC